VRIQRSDGATESARAEPLFAPHRTLALVDEPLPAQLAPVRDFVLPPFRPAEVVARVARMLTPLQAQTVLHAGNLELHTASRTASVGGRAVEFTFYEFEILRLLLIANGGVLSREDMVRHLGHDAPPDSRWVDIHIHRLRTKLRALRGASVDTVRGVGYRLTRL
jgi:two-component system alkaline phosphatase synthesis response regulator PhoP